MLRTIQALIPSTPTSDGDGVKIHRVSLFRQALADPFYLGNSNTKALFLYSLLL